MPETNSQQQLRQKCIQYKQLQQENEAQLEETQKHLKLTEEQLTQTIRKLHRTEDLHTQTLKLLQQTEELLSQTQSQLQETKSESQKNAKDSFSIGYAKGSEEAHHADFANNLKEIQMEIRMMMHLAGNPTKFGGDGPENFNLWVQQTERTLIQLENSEERARFIVLKTLEGPASDFMVREIQNNPNITWKKMKAKLSERYNDSADMAYSRQKLRKIKQLSTESVQNYYERFMGDVTSAYSEEQLHGDYIQGELTEIFTYGLISDNMVRHIIRRTPKIPEDAFKLAIAEQEAQKTFELHRGTEKGKETEISNLEIPEKSSHLENDTTDLGMGEALEVSPIISTVSRNNKKRVFHQKESTRRTPKSSESQMPQGKHLNNVPAVSRRELSWRKTKRFAAAKQISEPFSVSTYNRFSPLEDSRTDQTDSYEVTRKVKASHTKRSSKFTPLLPNTERRSHIMSYPNKTNLKNQMTCHISAQPVTHGRENFAAYLKSSHLVIPRCKFGELSRLTRREHWKNHPIWHAHATRLDNTPIIYYLPRQHHALCMLTGIKIPYVSAWVEKSTIKINIVGLDLTQVKQPLGPFWDQTCELKLKLHNMDQDERKLLKFGRALQMNLEQNAYVQAWEKSSDDSMLYHSLHRKCVLKLGEIFNIPMWEYGVTNIRLIQIALGYCRHRLKHDAVMQNLWKLAKGAIHIGNKETTYHEEPEKLFIKKIAMHLQKDQPDHLGGWGLDLKHIPHRLKNHWRKFQDRWKNVNLYAAVGNPIMDHHTNPLINTKFGQEETILEKQWYNRHRLLEALAQGKRLDKLAEDGTTVRQAEVNENIKNSEMSSEHGSIPPGYSKHYISIPSASTVATGWRSRISDHGSLPPAVNKTYWYKEKASDIEVNQIEIQNSSNFKSFSQISEDNQIMDQDIPINKEDEMIGGAVPEIGTTDPSAKEKVMQLLRNNEHIFAATDLDLGTTNISDFEINTEGKPPIRLKPYRCPWSQKKILEEHIQSMLDAGVIVPSTSPYSFPALLVPKPECRTQPGVQKFRFCVDYRRLNQQTKKNNYPLPNISDLMDSLNGSKVFSSLDLRSGYWQVKLKDSDREKSAFITHCGLYEFVKMPFGLCNAPAAFAQIMQTALGDALFKHALCYLDDIIVHSKDIESHLIHLQDVFNRLEKAGLKLKASKCQFLCDELAFLGHIVSAKGVHVSPEKVAAIARLPPCDSAKSVRGFLGMAGYYRKFIPNMAEIARPLTQLTKKNSKFNWTEECQRAFDTLKQKLTSAPVLAFPSNKLPFVVYTDSSAFAVGSILAQTDENGDERVIQYASQQLNDTQSRWSASEREAYAIIVALNRFRQYLLGNRFTLYSDHMPLRSLFTADMKNARIQRWAVILSEYDMDIKYKKGSTMKADFLSRIPPIENNPAPDIDENKYLPEINLISQITDSCCSRCHSIAEKPFSQKDMGTKISKILGSSYPSDEYIHLCKECEAYLLAEDDSPALSSSSPSTPEPLEPYQEYSLEIEHENGQCKAFSHDTTWDYVYEDLRRRGLKPGEPTWGMTSVTSQFSYICSDSSPCPQSESDFADSEGEEYDLSEVEAENYFSNKAMDNNNISDVWFDDESDDKHEHYDICAIDTTNKNWRQMDDIPNEDGSVPVTEELEKMLENIPEAQNKDPDLAVIRNQLKRGKNLKDYLLVDDVLFHIAKPIVQDPEPRIQLVIPQKMVGVVLRAYHDPYHMGISKTYGLIHQRYFWETSYRDCILHVKRCMPCARANLKIAKAPLAQADQADQAKFPFDKIGIDCSGPWPESDENQYKYIISIVCLFSGWPECFPARDKSAETVAKILLLEIIPRHSVPTCMLSDMGSEFVNEVVDILSSNLGILRITTTPFHPQGNALTERWHRTMKMGLKKRLNEYHKNWPDMLGAVVFAYRVSPQETTKQSPFLTIYGREPCLPADTLFRPKTLFRNEDCWVKNQLQRLHQAFALVKINTRLERERQKKLYDRKASPHDLEEGDNVWYYYKKQIAGPAKLQHQWQPYYKIVSFKSPVTAIIRHLPTNETRTVHVNNLRAAYQDGIWDKMYNTPEPVGNKPVNNPKRLAAAREAAREAARAKSTRKQPFRSHRLAVPGLLASETEEAQEPAPAPADPVPVDPPAPPPAQAPQPSTSRAKPRKIKRKFDQLEPDPPAGTVASRTRSRTAAPGNGGQDLKKFTQGESLKRGHSSSSSDSDHGIRVKRAQNTTFDTSSSDSEMSISHKDKRLREPNSDSDEESKRLRLQLETDSEPEPEKMEEQ